MRKVLTSTLLALFLLGSAGFGPTLSTQDKVINSIVRVEFPDPETDGTHLCAGFVVSASKGQVLTAEHCVPMVDEDVWINGDPSKVIRKSDLFALVKIPPMSKPSLDLRKSGLVLGEPVMSFGYAYNYGMTLFKRAVAIFKDGDFGLDGPLAPGMSGGPIVDMDGKVVGINQASSGVLGVACGANEIADFLKEK